MCNQYTINAREEMTMSEQKKPTATEAMREKVLAKKRQLEQAQAKLRLLEIREKAQASKQARADDLRRKILLGSMILAAQEEDAAFHANAMTRMDAYLLRSDDRKLFGLPLLVDAKNAGSTVPQNASGELKPVEETKLAGDFASFKDLALRAG
jgi:hypothetical protein